MENVNYIGLSRQAIPPASDSTANTLQSRHRDISEVALVYVMVLLVFWTPHPLQEAMWAIAAATIAVLVLRSSGGFRAIGLRLGNLFCWLWAIAAAGSIAGLAIGAAVVLHTLHLPDSPGSILRNSFDYVLWAAIQQFVLQCFFLARLLRVLGHAGWAAGATALLFAMAHLPSPLLMLITLVFGLASCLFFARYRSLYPLVIAHAVLGLAIAFTIPSSIDRDMRVGLAYLTWTSESAHLNPPPGKIVLAQP
jgi:membrane protease YdiL (CAAX protease family)